MKTTPASSIPVSKLTLPIAVFDERDGRLNRPLNVIPIRYRQR